MILKIHFIYRRKFEPKKVKSDLSVILEKLLIHNYIF